MKPIKKFTFATLATVAALAAALLFQTSTTQAHDQGQRGGQGQRDDDHERGGRDRDHRDAKVTFTKWITGDPNLPGLLQTLEGVVGGDVGKGIFAGEVLKETIVGDLDEVVAFYHFTGSKHSFSAIIHLKFDLVSLQGVVIGVVTDGWLKGHALKGRMRAIDSFQGHSPAFEATFEINRD